MMRFFVAAVLLSVTLPGAGASSRSLRQFLPGFLPGPFVNGTPPVAKAHSWSDWRSDWLCTLYGSCASVPPPADLPSDISPSTSPPSEMSSPSPSPPPPPPRPSPPPTLSPPPPPEPSPPPPAHSPPPPPAPSPPPPPDPSPSPPPPPKSSPPPTPSRSPPPIPSSPPPPKAPSPRPPPHPSPPPPAEPARLPPSPPSPHASPSSTSPPHRPLTHTPTKPPAKAPSSNATTTTTTDTSVPPPPPPPHTSLTPVVHFASPPPSPLLQGSDPTFLSLHNSVRARRAPAVPATVCLPSVLCHLTPPAVPVSAQHAAPRLELHARRRGAAVGGRLRLRALSHRWPRGEPVHFHGHPQPGGRGTCRSAVRSDELRLLTRLPQAVNAWAREILLYNFSNPDFSEATGHATQVLWKASTQLVRIRASRPRRRLLCIAPRFDPTARAPLTLSPAGLCAQDGLHHAGHTGRARRLPLLPSRQRHRRVRRQRAAGQRDIIASGRLAVSVAPPAGSLRRVDRRRRPHPSCSREKEELPRLLSALHLY